MTPDSITGLSIPRDLVTSVLRGEERFAPGPGVPAGPVLRVLATASEAGVASASLSPARSGQGSLGEAA